MEREACRTELGRASVEMMFGAMVVGFLVGVQLMFRFMRHGVLGIEMVDIVYAIWRLWRKG